LKDIAAETGYSIKTVSRAIHDHPDIKPETRAQILEVVRRHGFTPQWAAQSLRIRKTHTVGFVVPNLINGFFGQIAMTIDAHFREARYSTLICFTAKSLENELDSLGMLLAKNVDGIIFAPSGRSVDYFEAFPPLRDKPLVIIDNRCENIDACHVLHDDSFGMRLLADHLIARGHRAVGFIGGPLEESSAVGRLEGYKAALAHHGLAVEEQFIRIADWDRINGGHEATVDLLEKARGRLTAILYANSQLLLGGYKAIHAMGLRMPDDVAVAGFDPPYEIDSLVPRPTALAGVEEEIGLTAARLLQDLMNGKKPPADKEIRIRSELRIAESSG
ncbi:MAG: LacI family DNA-binding transcriptional regulator, partial [Spirochaetes bacterium]|nr:LacI family DNA-binding transcriptional regulator [Spirochaetota bacterium]